MCTTGIPDLLAAKGLSFKGLKKISIMDTRSAHGENLYFEGEGTITLL